MLISDLEHLEYYSKLPKIIGGSNDSTLNNYVFLSLKNGLLSLTVNDRQVVNNKPLSELPAQDLPLTEASFVWVSSSSQATGGNATAATWVALGVAPYHSPFFPFGLSALSPF